MLEPRPWTCPQCQSEQIDERICQTCGKARYQSWDVMISHHVLEHIADGLSDNLAIQEAMNARPCYAGIRGGFTLQFIAQRIRLLTKDTRKFAIDLARAKSAAVFAEALETGTITEKLRVMEKWGPETNAERVDHGGEVITKHVVELHEGPPPKGDA